MYLTWFGVHYWRSDMKYPTDPVKAVLQGKPLPDRTQTPTADEPAVLEAAQAQPARQQGVAPGTVVGQPRGVARPGRAGDGAQNQDTGKLLAAAYGWSTGDPVG